jgi:hypothetical protein
MEAGVPGESSLKPVGAAVGVGQEKKPTAYVASGTLDEEHGLGPVFLFEVVHPLFNEIIGFIPGDLFPLVLSPLADPLQGVPETVGVVNIIFYGQRPGAESAVVVRMVGVPLHFDQLPVLNVEKNSASPVAAGPGGPGDGFHNFFPVVVWFHFFLLRIQNDRSGRFKSGLKNQERILFRDLPDVHG